MNRRQFILGIASAAALPVTGKASYALNLTADEKFMAAFIAAYQDYLTNVWMFGIGALQYTDTFPYIESINPRDILIDTKDTTTLKGLLP